MLSYIPIPFYNPPMPDYGLGFYDAVIGTTSLKLVIFSHVPTAILAIVFGILVYKKSRQLSSFYLMLLCLNFAIWLYFDLLTWSSASEGIMFGWATIDIINVISYCIAYWFLYSFVRGYDVPLWQKIITACALIPNIVITLLSLNMDTYSADIAIAVEHQTVLLYNTGVRVFFTLFVIGFSLNEYRKTNDELLRKKIFFAGLGITVLIFLFMLTELISLLLLVTNLFNIAETGNVYTVELYGFFGIPMFLGFLAYLIAKYQAFDIKLLKTVGLIIILQLLLFITIFI